MPRKSGSVGAPGSNPWGDPAPALALQFRYLRSVPAAARLESYVERWRSSPTLRLLKPLRYWFS